MDTHKFKIPYNNYIYKDFDLDGRGYSEGLKISNLDNIYILRGKIIGGDEDCIDCVRGSNYLFEDLILEAGHARVFITAKGGIDGLTMKNILLKGKVRWPWDISLGDHTIYNDQGENNLMKNVILDGFSRSDGKKVVVLCKWCERPVTKNGIYRVVMLPKWVVRILFTINKYINATRKKINFSFSRKV